MTNTTEGQEIKEVVLLVHGIRTYAEWQDTGIRVLKTPQRRIVAVKYGKFDLLRFWCPIATRKGPIKRIEKEFQTTKDNYPGAQISVIAHSFGTYAIGQVISDNPGFKLKRLVLCGSILDREFRWDKVKSQIEQDVVNEYSGRDIWPLLARSLTWGYDSSGTYSFGGVIVQDRWHEIDHSGYLKEKFVREYWLPWFDEGRLEEGKKQSKLPIRRGILGIWGLKYLLIFLFFASLLALWPIPNSPPPYPGTISDLVQQYKAAESRGDGATFIHGLGNKHIRGTVVVERPTQGQGYIVTALNDSSPKTKINITLVDGVYLESLAHGTNIEVAGTIEGDAYLSTIPIVLVECSSLKIIANRPEL